MATRNAASAAITSIPQGEGATPEYKALLLRIAAIILFTTAVASTIYQGTTFSLPKVFEERLTGIAGSATLIGSLAFVVFAVASVAQVVVGRALDRHGARAVFATVATLQCVFLAAMPGLTDWWAFLVALAFMLGTFGQIPINDYMIGRMAKSELRASIYGARFVIGFGVWAVVVPLIAWVHHNWGFDMLFYILAGCSGALLFAVLLLPRRLPEAVPAVQSAA